MTHRASSSNGFEFFSRLIARRVMRFWPLYNAALLVHDSSGALYQKGESKNESQTMRIFLLSAPIFRADDSVDALNQHR